MLKRDVKLQLTNLATARRQTAETATRRVSMTTAAHAAADPESEDGPSVDPESPTRDRAWTQRVRRRTERGLQRVRGGTERGPRESAGGAWRGTAAGGRLKATSGPTARSTQRRHGVAVVGAGQAVEDEVDRVAHVEDRLGREQLVAVPVRRRRILCMPAPTAITAR